MPEGLPFFLAREQEVWEALRRGDVASANVLLAENFLGVYESGLNSKAQYLSRLSNGPVVEHYRIEVERFMSVSPTLVLLTYKASWVEATQAPRRAYITSAWEHREGAGWVNVFSQDTEIHAATAA